MIVVLPILRQKTNIPNVLLNICDSINKSISMNPIKDNYYGRHIRGH